MVENQQVPARRETFHHGLGAFTDRHRDICKLASKLMQAGCACLTKSRKVVSRIARAISGMIW